jgi:hypothetical protein
MKMKMKMEKLGIFTLACLLVACGERASTPDNNTTSPSASSNVVQSGAGCEVFPPSLITEVGMAYQMVLNLAFAGGKNLDSIEKSMGLPKPELFRAFATAFEKLDVSAVKPMSTFDKPEVSVPLMRELADKLEAALAQRNQLDHPAWTEFAEFTKRSQARQQMSMGYYLSELGCK